MGHPSHDATAYPLFNELPLLLPERGFVFPSLLSEFAAESSHDTLQHQKCFVSPGRAL